MKMYQSLFLTAFVLLSAVSSCKEKQEPTPAPEQEVKTASFTATLDASAPIPFKTAWAEGDAIQVIGVKDGKTTSETIKASSVSSTGATFTSNGTIKADCDEYYAFVSGTGVTGCAPASSWTISSTPAQTRSIAVAKCGKGGTSLSFRNMFSFLKIEVTDASVKSIELKGNKGEALNYDVVVSTSDYSISRAAKPAFEDQKVVKVDVAGTGACYISLIPGTVLEQGYTVTTYDASGKVVSRSVYSDKFSVANGKTSSAGELQPEAMVFTASFEDVTTPEFKSSWADGDVIEVSCFSGDNLLTETIMATDISSDRRTARFVSNGTLPAGASGYYAMIPGTGVDGYLKSNWSTANLAGIPTEKPTVTVANCTDGSGRFVFKNMFSLLGFKVDEPAVSYVVIEGNNSEKINKNLLISFNGFSVNGNSTPAFESTSSLKKNVKSGETYWFGLFPGLKLSKGFTITAYDAQDKVLGSSKNTSALTVEKGKVYNAAKFAIKYPSVKTKTFDESNIVMTLGVVSDVHINPQWTADKWKSALQQLKAKAAATDPNGMAGILVVGDLIDQPSTTQLGLFKSTLESEINVKSTPMIYTIGNHDVPKYAWASTMVNDVAYMRNMFGDDYFLTDQDQNMRTGYEARHCVIGDYHILSVSPDSDQPILYDPTVVSWLDSQLDKITKEDPERYVIVLTHPMIKNTVYGSMLGEADGIWSSTLPQYWATDALSSVLKKYPQAVVFGGHLHFPLNDPRSVWQGDFSVFGCASVRYMALENGQYEDMESATVMLDKNDFSQGNLLQFDASGNMRVLRMDFYNKDVIGDPIMTSYPTSDKSHLTKYNHTTRSLANAAPVLSTLDVDVNDGVVKATWAAGTDDEFVHHYVLTVKKSGVTVMTKKILADFYKHAKASEMRTEWVRSLGTFEDGVYELTLEAYDSWDAASKPLSKTFQVGSGSGNSLWTEDNSGSKAVSGGNGSVSEGWLSYADGKLSWTANTTGKPRTAALTLPNGTAYSVTQISVEDFKGGWTFNSSRFGGRGNYFTRNDKASDLVTVGDPRSSEALSYGDTKITNNLGLRGLAANLIMDAVVRINYEEQSVMFGLFFDGRKAQKITEGALSGTYGAFLPELSAGAWTSYEFGRTDIGTPDYEWLWLNVSVKNGSLSAEYLPFKQRINAAHSYKRDYIIGIEVMNFTGEDANDTNLVRSTTSKNTESGVYQADWIAIYQANYASASNGGMKFTKN